MHIQVQSTSKIVSLIPDTDQGIRARVWEGVTSSGTKVHVFITRIAIDDSEGDEVQAEFATQLQECAAPSAEIQAYPLRLII